ncbi:hypothetical protein TWF481_011947 [Arthrobotrys musiformis]|uniref:TPX2 C-terminal domain-containing protein n=1 Tax=Arthrobotrys musiformis TaxID=47236 RepID=A0AAV9VX51_9PEZI
MVRVVVLGGNNSGGGGSCGGQRSIDQEAIIRSYTHRPPSYSPSPLLPAQAAKHLRWLERRQQHFTRRLGLVPHHLYHGSKDVILRPPNFTTLFFAPIKAIIFITMDEENGIHQFPGEDAALVFTTPAFLKASSDDLFMNESPSPNPFYEETPIRPRRSARFSGGKTKPRSAATPLHIASASRTNTAPARTPFDGMSPFKMADFDLTEYLNISPEKQITRTPAPRLAKSRLNQLMDTAKPTSLGDFAFTTPAPSMKWITGNEENESPAEEMGMRTTTKAIDPRILELDETDDDEELAPLSNVKARSKPFSQRLSDRSSKRRRSDGIAALSERTPLQDLSASVRSTVQAEQRPLETPQEPSSPSDSEDLQTPRAVSQKPVDFTPRAYSTCSAQRATAVPKTPKAASPTKLVDATPHVNSTGFIPPTSSPQKSPSRLPLPTRRARALSDPPSLPSHVEKANSGMTQSLNTSTFANRGLNLDTATPKAEPAEVLSEEDMELMELPAFQGLPKSPMQLRKLVVHTQEILAAERRARIEAEKTIEFMTQERQFLMLQLDNAKKRAGSRTSSPRTRGMRRDGVTATPGRVRFADEGEDPFEGPGVRHDHMSVINREDLPLYMEIEALRICAMYGGVSPGRAAERRKQFIEDWEKLTPEEQAEKRKEAYLKKKREWREIFAAKQTYRKATAQELKISDMYMKEDLVRWRASEAIRKEEERVKQEEEDRRIAEISKLSYYDPVYEQQLDDERNRALEEEILQIRKRKAQEQQEQEQKEREQKEQERQQQQEKQQQQQRQQSEANRPTPATRPASRANSASTHASSNTQSSRPQPGYSRPGSSMATRREAASQTRPGSSLQTRPPSSLQNRPGSSLNTRSGASRPQSTVQPRTQPTRPHSRVQSTRPESRQEGPLRQKPVRGGK